MKRALSILLFVGVLLPAGTVPSGATFVSGSANPGSSFSTAADFNTVSVSLTNPGTPLRGNVTLTAVAASDRGIASVVFESAPAGTSTWTTACTDTVAPYSCTWDTTAVADGLRDVRAVATDTAGYSRTDTVIDRRVDNTAPTVATTDPGSPLTGTVAVGSTGVDTGSGIAAVTLQYRATAGAWTDVCTQATLPSSCSWNTTSLADGLYDLRTVATDVAGNSATSTAVSNRRVDNTAPAVVMTPPAAALSGSVTLQSTPTDGAGSGIASVRYEYKLSSGSTWSTACTSSTTPYSCSWNTTSVADGLYDVRAVATDNVAMTGTSAAVTGRRVDNAAPTAVTLGAVGTPLQNTVALTGTATDGASGIASLKFQYSPAGTGTWTDICTDTSSPYNCNWVTTGMTDGLYDLRTLATDNAGNTTASTVQTNRRVDNNGPTVAVTDPGPLRGTVTLGGTATDPVGVQSVTFEYRVPAGAWSAVCTDTTSPYACAGFDTTGVPDGNYEIRMQATDTLGHSSISAVMPVTVDNTQPTAVDIQAANGGTAGQIDTNDTLTFSYSELMDPASIMAGWNGSSTAVTVRVNKSGILDTLDVYSGATKVNLTSATQALQLQANYVLATANFNATMVRTGNSIFITFGTLVSGTPRTGITTAVNMIWTSSNAARDVAGNNATGNAVTESGAADRDF